MQEKMNSVSESSGSNKDFFIAIAGVILLVFIDSLLFIQLPDSRPVIALILLTLIPIGFILVYLLFRRKKRVEGDNNEQGRSPRSILLGINFCFFTLIILALSSIMFNQQPYRRPIEFFLFVSGAIGMISLEIFLSASLKKTIFMILPKILIISAILRIVPLTMIPGTYSDDPFYHQFFTSEIIRSGNIPSSTSYTNFPLMHLTLGSLMEIAHIDFKSASIVAVTLVQGLIWPSLLCIITSDIFKDIRAGLIAALVISFADTAIGYGILGAFPTTYALLFVLLIIWSIIKSRNENEIMIVALMVFFTFDLALSHSLTALFAIIVIIFLYVTKSIFSLKKKQKIIDNRLTGRRVTLLTIVIIGYWMLLAGFILDKLIGVLFLNEGFYASFSTVGGKEYSQTIPVIEYFLTLSGQFLIASISLIGFLYCLQRSDRNTYPIAMASLGLIFLIVGGLGQILGLGFEADRWMYYCYIFIPMACAFGTSYLINRSWRRKVSAIIITLFFIVTPFLMITDMNANYDSPIYSSDLVSPRFIRQSEIDSINQLLKINNGIIGTDNDFSSYMHYSGARNQTPLDFHTNEFTKFDGLILIRDFYLDTPIYSRGLYRMNQSGYAIILSPQFEKIFDSGTVCGFLTKSG